MCKNKTTNEDSIVFQREPIYMWLNEPVNSVLVAAADSCHIRQSRSHIDCTAYDKHSRWDLSKSDFTGTKGLIGRWRTTILPGTITAASVGKVPEMAAVQRVRAAHASLTHFSSALALSLPPPLRLRAR